MNKKKQIDLIWKSMDREFRELRMRSGRIERHLGLSRPQFDIKGNLINPDPAPECTCPPLSTENADVYWNKEGYLHHPNCPLSKLECCCWPIEKRKHFGQSFVTHPKCPVHGKKDPAPPLRARVAKALGENVQSDGGHSIWLLGTKTAPFLKEIPPYDEDDALAESAAIEYLNKLGKDLLFFVIKVNQDHGGIVAFFERSKLPYEEPKLVEQIPYSNGKRAEAISRLIVKHAEGK